MGEGFRNVARREMSASMLPEMWEWCNRRRLSPEGYRRVTTKPA
jgi:hypothetical protein